ncbi:MAG: hypothetical protein ACRDOV_05380 [Streptomyces sp.]
MTCSTRRQESRRCPPTRPTIDLSVVLVNPIRVGVTTGLWEIGATNVAVSRGGMTARTVTEGEAVHVTGTATGIAPVAVTVRAVVTGIVHVGALPPGGARTGAMAVVRTGVRTTGALTTGVPMADVIPGATTARGVRAAMTSGAAAAGVRTGRAVADGTTAAGTRTGTVVASVAGTSAAGLPGGRDAMTGGTTGAMAGVTTAGRTGSRSSDCRSMRTSPVTRSTRTCGRS